MYDYAHTNTRSGEGLRKRAERRHGEGLGKRTTHDTNEESEVVLVRLKLARCGELAREGSAVGNLVWDTTGGTPSAFAGCKPL
jgi:hypothetical protein